MNDAAARDGLCPFCATLLSQLEAGPYCSGCAGIFAWLEALEEIPSHHDLARLRQTTTLDPGEGRTGEIER